MIKKVEINGIHHEVSDDLKKYISKKIKKIERFVPKSSRQNLHVEVKLKEEKTKDKKNCNCVVVFHLPGEDIAADATTVNMYAATDIVIAKIKSQLEKYRDAKHGHGVSRANLKVRKFLGKIRSR